MINEALIILEALGVPTSDLTNRRRIKMAKAFMSVAGLKPGMRWTQIKDNDDEHRLLSRQIITHMNTYWGEDISSGSYDDIRRKDLALPVEALVILNSAKNPNATTKIETINLFILYF